MFVGDISGTLMQIKESNQTRFEFVVWFPYTRSSMMTIREGSLMATKNFSSDERVEHHSIMRITSVLPSHYALGTDLSGYPGFVEEAAVNASKDWSQERPTEDTTKIVCRAIPSMFEIRKPNPLGPERDEPKMVPESSIPMIGEKVRLLDADWTTRIINHDLQKLQSQTITLGKLANSDGVDIMALWDGLMRTHFGVFAYTNAGKSNLLSTVAAKIFEKADDVKIVIYDLMGEYGALLIDVLHDAPGACMVYLSPQAMPKSVLEFWKKQTDGNLDAAAKDIVNTTVLPKALMSRKPNLYDPVRKILRDGKVKILIPDETLSDIVSEVVASASRSSAALSNFVNYLEINRLRELITIDNANSLMGRLETHTISGQSVQTAREVKDKLLGRLRAEREKLAAAELIEPKFKIKQQDMLNSLNASGKKSIYIIQDNSDAQVRLMSHKLGKAMLRVRRERGQISPLVSFIYDEADQFIAQEGTESGMKESKSAAQELARRGRKYGLGIGIATQRIVYLDTNILGQPHTYFVSKLPRATDRERIQDAFGLSEETLRETLRFGVGQWLLISHSATGIDGLPIPIQLPDANARIIGFLGKLDGVQKT